MIKVIDIAWLGGLLEGEGYFALHRGRNPVISVGMTAEDTINKVSDMWDARVTHRKNMYYTQVNGARAAGWMMTLYPFLGKRRRESVTKAIKFWREH